MTHIEEIMKKEREICAKLDDVAVTEIAIPPAFFKEQIGLRQIMCDKLGRIWDTGDNPIRMIFDPFFNSREKTNG